MTVLKDFVLSREFFLWVRLIRGHVMHCSLSVRPSVPLSYLGLVIFISSLNFLFFSYIYSSCDTFCYIEVNS